MKEIDKKTLAELPIDFDCTDRELSDWMDSWKIKAFGEESLNPERYYDISKDGFYVLGIKKDDNLQDEKRLTDRVLELLCRIRLVNRQLKSKTIDEKFLSYTEAKEAKERREEYYKEYQDIINSTLGKDDTSTIPEKLNTPEAKEIFSKAIEAGLVSKTTGGYHWNNTKALCAYFAELASEHLKLGKGIHSGKTKISWKPFEIIFNMDGLCQAKRDYQNTGETPLGAEIVEKIFSDK